MLILEGTDCVGKTTLAHKLVQVLNKLGSPVVYQHMSRLPDSFDRYHGYINLMCTNVVKDRFYLSENAYCYGRMEHPTISSEQLRLLDAHARMLGAYTVLVTASLEVIRERYEKLKEREMYSLDLVERVHGYYNRLHAASKVDIDLSVDTSNFNPSMLENVATDIAMAYLARQSALATSLG